MMMSADDYYYYGVSMACEEVAGYGTEWPLYEARPVIPFLAKEMNARTVNSSRKREPVMAAKYRVRSLSAVESV